MRLIIDKQFKIVFDEPIEVTEDNIGSIGFLVNNLEMDLFDSDITIGPRKPNIKDVAALSDEGMFTGLLFTFSRGIARTGQIGIMSDTIKSITSTQMNIQGFNIPEEEMSIEEVNIFEEVNR